MKTILVVEDDKWLAEQYARVLDAEGYRTIVTLNALDAITAIDDYKVDAIILDVLLTGSTAFTLLHELQSYGDTGEIPVILCTNLASELSLKDTKPYGVRQIIDKSTMVPGDLTLAVKRLSL
jgi:DNA-binding response OmpR family regulator